MKKLCCFFAVLLFVGPSIAQTLGTGAYPFASFDNRGFDAVNLGNLNTRFNVPIISRSGRGMGFNYSVQYEGLIWTPSTSAGNPTWTPDPAWGFSGLLNGTTFSGYLTYSTLSESCSRPPNYSGLVLPAHLLTNYVYHDPFGGSHRFNYSYNSGCPLSNSEPTTTGNGSSSDGSGYSLVGGYQVSTRSGSLITPAQSATGQDNTSITDSNGNTINSNSGSSFTDTLGVTALTLSGSSPRTLTYPVTLQSNSATSASATISYVTYNVQTNFQCSGISEYGSNAASLVDRITLADGSYYAFTYEPTPGVQGAVTARVAAIVLPTGGTISYTYNSGCNGSGINSDGSTAGLVRSTSDGSRTYTRAGINAGSSTTVQDEKGNQTIYDFVADSASGRYFETHRQVYQNAVGGTPLVERITCYNGISANPNCDGQSLALPVTEADVTESYNGGSQTLTKNSYDSSGTLLTSSSFYSGTMLLENVTNTYNSLGKVLTSVTQDGSGNTVASSSYGYDETSVTATSNVPQHTTPSSPAGNQTSAHVSTGSGTLDTTMAYYDTGVPMSTTAPGGFTTSYTYDSTQAFATGTTLPTPSSGVALSTSAIYDQQSTMPISVTGMNGDQTQVTQYDALLRPLAVSLPIGGGSYTYSPNLTGVYQVISSNQSTNLQTLFDAYGRNSRVAMFNGQSNGNTQWYQTDYCYDPSGLLQFQPTPYAGSGFDGPSANKQCSGNGTTYTYDALGRVTGSSSSADGPATTMYQGRAVKTTDVNNVQKITQYDLLGRLSGVCEISSNTNLPGSGSPIACGMDIVGTGFVTSYAYDLANHKTTVTQGVQTRIFQTDWAGRTIMTSEPERGITTYGYSYNSTGLQVTRTRPRANQSSATVYTTTTTQYDSLERPTAVSYMDGGATNPLTTGKSFTYDLAQLPGIGYSTGYGKGRLIGAVGATIDVFNYDIAGNITGYFQCLPAFCGHSGAFGHDLFFNYSYDWTGNRTSDQYQNWGANGALVTTNYAYNPASQLTSISGGQNDATGAPNILSVSQIGPVGPSTWTYGNGLTAGQTYDTLGRVSAMGVCSDGSFQPQCNAGLQYNFSVTPHGSQVSNSCDYARGQCVTYGYDEFNRLTSYAATSPPNFTYTYDRYGNRWSQNAPQGGPAPGFMFPGNNQIGGMSYDAAGNQLTDGAYSYNYDAEGNLVNVNGGQTASYVYDSFNRRVEHRWAGNSSLDMPAIEETAYNPEGKRVEIWDGSTGNMVQAQTYWGSLPVAYYKEGQIHFQHQDWLGSERITTAFNAAIETGSSTAAFGDDFGTNGRDIDAYHFAGLDVDYATGTNHAQFREYSVGQGHWMSPDPYDGSYDLGNPQSLNRYAYVLNNPLSYIDSSGRNCVDTQGDDGSITTNCTVDGGDPWTPIVTFLPPAGPGGQGAGAAPPVAPSNSACTAQRIYSGIMGAANLGLAITKGVGLGAAVAGLGATGAGAPAAAVLGVYGTVSIFGQGLSGAAQLYSAFTGNYGTPGRVAQVGNILSGPVSGLGTLAAGGSAAAAERNAGYESFFTAGSGFIDAIRSAGNIPLAAADHSAAYFGAFGNAGNACGAGH